MSGHSKWHEIKRKKAVKDARRGKAFSRCAKDIMIAAREGGGNPDHNARLRLAIQVARSLGMPGENIARAIKKGTGELGGANLEPEIYEGYGPHGVALLIDTLTDNRNRTVNEVRNVLHKRGGSMGTTGCVSYLFNRKGVITVDRDGYDEDTVLEAALEAGAEDMITSKDSFQIITAPEDCEAVTLRLEAQGINPSSSEVTMLPSVTVALSDIGQARGVLRLLDELEELEDVQKVYSNFDIDDELMKQIEEEE